MPFLWTPWVRRYRFVDNVCGGRFVGPKSVSTRNDVGVRGQSACEKYGKTGWSDKPPVIDVDMGIRGRKLGTRFSQGNMEG